MEEKPIKRTARERLLNAVGSSDAFEIGKLQLPEISDVQWLHLQYLAKLPDEARQEFQMALHRYWRDAADEIDEPDTKRLLDALPERIESLLLDLYAIARRKHASHFIREEGVEVALAACDALSPLIPILEREQLQYLKSGRRSKEALRLLIRRIDSALKSHCGVPLTRTKKRLLGRAAPLDFAVEVCKLADPEIQFTSVEEAVRNLSREK